MFDRDGQRPFPDRPVPARDAGHGRSALRTRGDRDVRARRRGRAGHRHGRDDRRARACTTCSSSSRSTRATAPDAPVHFGGPVEPRRGFVLHCRDWGGQDTLDVAGRWALSSTSTCCARSPRARGRRRWLVALGYAGWGAGQLDGELTAPGWFNAPGSTTSSATPLSRIAGRRLRGRGGRPACCWRTPVTPNAPPLVSSSRRASETASGDDAGRWSLDTGSRQARSLLETNG